MVSSLPTFLICGTQKGGTTSLYHYLRDHPEIYMPLKKEVHFFDLNFHRGLDWYKEHFKVEDEKIKAIGEATPFYMYLETVPKRIHKTIPNAKLIFILRDPVKRAYSHYWHELMSGYEILSFEEAIRREEERLSKGTIFVKQHYSYKDRGKYVIQLKRYMKYFTRNQMLILILEELKKNPINYIENKLGLPIIESTILPCKKLSEMGLYTCVEVKGLNHPYHYFVLNLLYQAIKYRLNKIYGEIFSGFRLNRLVIDYYFGEGKTPFVNYNNGVLSITYFVPSEKFKGLHVKHEYGSDLTFNISESGDNITISFGWSDVCLLYTSPSPRDRG